MLDGRYEYKQLLGKGGNGAVYLCYDHKLNKYWAVKEFQGEINNERNKELNLLKTISSNCFPRIVDAVFEENRCCLVMDFIEGENLKKVLKKGPMKEGKVVDIALQISEGLQYLHNCNPAMIYMDCKPENIILNENGKIKLIDFGSVFIVKTTDSQERKQKISGSRFYAPFEQRKAREEEIDATTDIYALGMTLFVLLIGKELMVSGKKHLSVRKYNRGISRGMDYVIKKCTETDKRKRFQSMEEFRQALLQRSKIGKRENLKLHFYSCVNFFEKIFLTMSFLFLLWYSKEFHQWKMGIFSFVLFLLLMLQFSVKKEELWERKKDISCVTVKKLLMNLFLCSISTIFLTACGLRSKPLENQLDVTLYDQEFRKILIKNGCAWTIEEDILLSVPKEEILSQKGYIEVTYVADHQEEKKFRFLVEK